MGAASNVKNVLSLNAKRIFLVNSLYLDHLTFSLKGAASNVNFQEGAASNAFFVLSLNGKRIFLVNSLYIDHLTFSLKGAASNANFQEGAESIAFLFYPLMLNLFY